MATIYNSSTESVKLCRNQGIQLIGGYVYGYDV